MKKHFKLSILFLTSLLAFTSCEDVVQVKLDEGSKLYVIDAFVNNLRGIQSIRVVTNDSYFSNREAPPVTGAQVILTDLTISKAYTFTYSSNGYYTYDQGTADTIARVNHQYKLEVTIDGKTYSSLNIQKRPASIDSIGVLPNDGGGFGPPSTDSSYICYLFAKDKADNVTDYYWIKTFRNDSLFKASSDLNVCIDGTNGAVINAPQDSIDFTAPGTFLGFKSYRKGDKCRVEIHSINRDTYFFFIQASAQINNGGLFATTPENVKTNILTPSDAKTKAIGRFEVSSVAVKERLVK